MWFESQGRPSDRVIGECCPTKCCFVGPGGSKDYHTYMHRDRNPSGRVTSRTWGRFRRTHTSGMSSGGPRPYPKDGLTSTSTSLRRPNIPVGHSTETSRTRVSGHRKKVPGRSTVSEVRPVSHPPAVIDIEKNRRHKDRCPRIKVWYHLSEHPTPMCAPLLQAPRGILTAARGSFVRESKGGTAEPSIPTPLVPVVSGTREGNRNRQRTGTRRP